VEDTDSERKLGVNEIHSDVNAVRDMLIFLQSCKELNLKIHLFAEIFIIITGMWYLY
jgi:hypothetical protein